MANILEKIVEFKKREVQAEIDTYGREVPRRLFELPEISFSRALNESPTGIIAEFKRRSPSRGDIHPMADAAVIVPGYEAAGAAACSILTDTPFFGGSMSDFLVARPRVSLPLLRKEFIIHPRQIEQAAAMGANAVLLIAAILTQDDIELFTEQAHSLGMEVLFEIHNITELEKFCPAIDMVGVNNRDLTTFRTDPELSFKVASRLPADVIKVAESGLTDMAEVQKLREHGYRGFLIGETFMKSDNPPGALKQFINSKV